MGRYGWSALLMVLVSVGAGAAENFAVVVPGAIYRSGTFQGAADLEKTVSAHSLRSIVSLEDGWRATFPPERERDWCVANNVRFLNPALSGFEKPSASLIRQIALDLVSTEKPLLIHCRYGRDRTGLVIAAYRMLVQGWSLRDAYSEMVRHGHNPAGWFGDWKTVLEEIDSNRPHP